MGDGVRREVGRRQVVRIARFPRMRTENEGI